MGPTTLASLGLALLALLILGLTAYGYYLLLFDGASLQRAEDDPQVRIDDAVRDLRSQIEEYERRHHQS